MAAQRTPIIIDTDPGIDDAVALMLAAASSEVELLGITTVAGNVGIEVTTRNALALRQLLRLECPVGQGAARTLAAQQADTAAHVHGSNGLGGWVLPQAPVDDFAAALKEPAIALLGRLLRESAARGQKATIVAVGPLTNIAQLLIADSEAHELIDKIVLMGGGLGQRLGNVTPHAEFNIYTDPEAAAVVLKSGLPVTMVGLNVTELATLGFMHLPELFAHGGPIAEGLEVMLNAYRDTPEEPGVTAQHDSLAVAYVIKPELLQTVAAQVTVQVDRGPRRGETTVDFAAPRSCVQVATDVDVAAFRSFMSQRLFTAAQRIDK